MTTKPTSRLSLLPWIIWGLAALFYFYEFLLQVSPGVMVNDLMRDFQVNATALGNLTAIYFYAYAGMQIPVGILIDRFGPRRMLTIAVLVCALGAWLFSAAHLFSLLILSRFIIGAGSAFAVVSCMNLAARWFPTHRFALIAGLTITVGMFGAVFGEAPLALAVKQIGWQHTILLFMFIGLLLGLLIWLIVRDHPENISAHDIVSTSFWQNLKTVLRKPQNWIVATYGGLMYSPTLIFGSLWGVPYLKTEYHFSNAVAAFLVSTIFMGWAIGSPFFGWLSDRVGRRKVPMITGSVGALITIVCILYIPNLSKPILILLLFAFGVFSSGFLLAYSIIKENNLARHNATSIGFMNTLNMIGAIVTPPLIGVVLDHYWTGKMMAGVRMYSPHNFHIALSAIPVLIVIALLLLPIIRETFCVQQAHD